MKQLADSAETERAQWETLLPSWSPDKLKLEESKNYAYAEEIFQEEQKGCAERGKEGRETEQNLYNCFISWKHSMPNSKYMFVWGDTFWLELGWAGIPDSCHHCTQHLFSLFIIKVHWFFSRKTVLSH